MIYDLWDTHDRVRDRIPVGQEKICDEWTALHDQLTALDRRFERLRNDADECSAESWHTFESIASEIRDGFSRIRIPR